MKSVIVVQVEDLPRLGREGVADRYVCEFFVVVKGRRRVVRVVSSERPAARGQ
jgi:hypothetical protein